jgi:hypothetical protein
MIFVLAFYFLQRARTRHPTALRFRDELPFEVVYESKSGEPIVTVYGGWIGWPDNADLRDGASPPTEIFLVLLPTVNNFDELQFWESFVPILNVGEADRFESPDWRPFFVNGTRNHRPYSSIEVKKQFYSLATRQLRADEYINFAAGDCVDMSLSISFPQRQLQGSKMMSLCSEQRSHEKRSRTRPSLGNVALCVPAVDNVVEWRYSLPQYIAWYLVHHEFAHIYVFARPNSVHSNVWEPLIASGRVTVRPMPLPPMPSSWNAEQGDDIGRYVCGCAPALTALPPQ